MHNIVHLFQKQKIKPGVINYQIESHDIQSELVSCEIIREFIPLDNISCF